MSLLHWKRYLEELADRRYAQRSVSYEYPAYTPASWQAEEFHKSKKHIKVLFGGDRAAKTGTVGYELISLTRRFDNCLFWAAALTEDKLYAVWEWHKKWFAPWEIPAKNIKWRKSGIIPDYIKLPRNNLLQYKTWKSGPGAFSADPVKAIQLDEDGARVISTAEQVFNDCLSRILDNDGYILLGATPVLGKNWMYRRLHERNAHERKKMGFTGIDIPDPDIETWTVSLLDNRFIPDEYKERQKGRLTADEIDRRFYGLFTTLQGAVFKEWDEKRHVREFQVSNLCRKAVGIDLGAKHPFCGLFGGYYDEKIWVWDEYYEDEKGKVTSAEHAAALLEYESRNEYFKRPPDPVRYEDRLCDHDLQERIDLESFGYWTSPATKNTELSWLVINRLLKENRLVIHPRCYELIRTMPLYRYKEQKEGTDQKEIVLKEDDDPVDALRYLVMYFLDDSGIDYHAMSNG